MLSEHLLNLLQSSTAILLFLNTRSSIFSELPESYGSGPFFTKKHILFDSLKATLPFRFFLFFLQEIRN